MIDYTEITGPLIRVGVIEVSSEEEAQAEAQEHLGTDLPPHDINKIDDLYEVSFEVAYLD